MANIDPKTGKIIDAEWLTIGEPNRNRRQYDLDTFYTREIFKPSTAAMAPLDSTPKQSGFILKTKDGRYIDEYKNLSNYHGSAKLFDTVMSALAFADTLNQDVIVDKIRYDYI